MQEEKAMEAEVVQESNISMSSAAGELLSMQGQIDPEQLEKIANARVEFYRKIALLSLKLTSVHDWVDESGKPYLQASGAKKLMKLWGVKISESRMEMEMDNASGLPMYRFWGKASSRVLFR